MDLVKRHLFPIVVGTVTLIVSGVGLFVMAKSIGEARKYQKKVDEIQSSLEEFRRAKWALTTTNVDRAKKNAEKAEARYAELLEQLQQFVVPEDDERAKLRPPVAKNYIKQVCTKMENQLRGEEIRLADTLTSFSFDKYDDPRTLPKPEDIPTIVKQLEIVQELIFLISQSEIESLDEFTRVSGLDMVKRDLYDYLPFTLTVSGNEASVRRFLASLSDARYFFLVRELQLSSGARESAFAGFGAADGSEAVAPRSAPRGMGIMGPGGRRPRGRQRRRTPAQSQPQPKAEPEKKAFLSKDDRLVYGKPVVLTAAITLDYIEFHKKE